MTSKKLIRCRGALERLEAQLASGEKRATILDVVNNTRKKDVVVPLSKDDTARIKQEIKTLKTNLKVE